MPSWPAVQMLALHSPRDLADSGARPVTSPPAGVKREAGRTLELLAGGGERDATKTRLKMKSKQGHSV